MSIETRALMSAVAKGRKPSAATIAALTTHGMAGTPVYRCWEAMKRRCCNPRDAAYARYGGRGITVCDRWMTFPNFYADMGDRPPGLSLDRIDNDGNYEPGNCRWATATEQVHNRRRRLTCRRGHLLDEANTYVRPHDRARLCRRCRAAVYE